MEVSDGAAGPGEGGEERLADEGLQAQAPGLETEPFRPSAAERLIQLKLELEAARLNIAAARVAEGRPSGKAAELLAAAEELVETAYGQVARMAGPGELDDYPRGLSGRTRSQRLMRLLGLPWRSVVAAARAIRDDWQNPGAKPRSGERFTGDDWRELYVGDDFAVGFAGVHIRPGDRTSRTEHPKAKKITAVQIRVPEDAKPGDVVPVPLPELDMELPLTIPDGADPGDVLQVMIGSEEDDDKELPPSRGVGASLKIAIPADAKPGDRLKITTPANQTVEVRVPPGSSPGEVVEVRVPGEEDPTERPLEVRELDLGLRAAGLAKEPLQAVDRALRAARMRRPKLWKRKLPWARRAAGARSADPGGPALPGVVTLDAAQVAAIQAARVRSVLKDVDRALRFKGVPSNDEFTTALRTAGIRSPEEVLQNFANALDDNDLELPEENVAALVEGLKETGLELPDEMLEILAAAFFVELEIGPGLAVGTAAAEAVQDVLHPSQRLVLSSITPEGPD